MADNQLAVFLSIFASSFRPPAPRLSDGGTWLVSKVWSDYLRGWLKSNFTTHFEYPVGDGRRLDAALWSHRSAVGSPDVALEWEWDNNKVHRDFPTGDFRKLFEVDARCGVAIVHLRSDGTRGTCQADETLDRIRASHADRNSKGRPAGLVEIRRVSHSRQRVEFVTRMHDLESKTTRELGRLRYP